MCMNRKKSFFCSLFFLLFSSISSSEVQILGLSDVHFGAWNGYNHLRSDQLLCIVNNPLFSYHIIASSMDGHFLLSNGIHSIQYSVLFNSKPRPSGRIQLHANQLSPVFFNINNICASGYNAFLRIKINKNQLQNASSGRYSGRLFLTIIPE